MLLRAATSLGMRVKYALYGETFIVVIEDGLDGRQAALISEVRFSPVYPDSLFLRFAHNERPGVTLMCELRGPMNNTAPVRWCRVLERIRGTVVTTRHLSYSIRALRIERAVWFQST